MAEPYEMIQKGLELLEQDKYNDAEQWILRGVQGYEKRKDRSGVHFGMGRLGYCYERVGQIDQAIQTYEQSVAGGTDIPATFAGLVPLLVSKGQLDHAFDVVNIWSERSQFSPPSRAQDIFISIASSMIHRDDAAQSYDLLDRTLRCYTPKAYPIQYWQIRGLGCVCKLIYNHSKIIARVSIAA